MTDSSDATAAAAERRALVAAVLTHGAAAYLFWELFHDRLALRGRLTTGGIEAGLGVAAMTALLLGERSVPVVRRTLLVASVYGSAMSLSTLPWLDRGLAGAETVADIWLLGLVAGSGFAATLSTALSHPRRLFLTTLAVMTISVSFALLLASQWAHLVGVLLWASGLAVASQVGHVRVSGLEAGLGRSEEAARLDSLTGVLNRSPFMHELQRAGRAEPSRTALAIFDIDGFKAVNDSFGPVAGDGVLMVVASRLQESLPAGSQVGRLGGDEFGALIPCDDLDVAQTLDGLKAKLVRRIDVDGRRLYIDASVGWTLVRQGTEPAELLGEADAAMYRSKRSETVATTAFDGQMAEELAHALEQRQRFRAAVRAARIEFVAQPIVAAATRTLTAVELLARWPDGDGESIEAAEFSRLAGETGLAVELDRLALRAAGDLLAAWRADPRQADVTVKVNITPTHVHTLALEGSLSELIAADDLPRLGLELVETQLVRLGERHHELLRELRDGGMSISIDDFGTGYSSFAYLRDLPATEIKLDRSFVTDVEADEVNRRLVKGMVEVAQTFGLRVVAEGVETDSSAELLAALGVDGLQGYAIGRPLSPALIDATAFGQPGTSHD